MTNSNAARYRELRRRFDRDERLSESEMAQFLALDRSASDELDAAVAVHPLVRHDHAITVGGGAWSCACGEGQGGLGPDAFTGAHAHLRSAIHHA